MENFSLVKCIFSQPAIYFKNRLDLLGKFSTISNRLDKLIGLGSCFFIILFLTGILSKCQTAGQLPKLKTKIYSSLYREKEAKTIFAHIQQKGSKSHSFERMKNSNRYSKK